MLKASKLKASIFDIIFKSVAGARASLWGVKFLKGCPNQRRDRGAMFPVTAAGVANVETKHEAE